MSFMTQLFFRRPAPEETVSVVLRRQVPVRLGESPRSWLGGLPCLPEGVDWPRAGKGKPLHFAAQIDCAALPAALWGGLGPRTGWLLLFVDFDAIDGQHNRPMAKVLHADQLGPETEPPPGLNFARRDVVDHARLPGHDAAMQRRHFRKWPIDLVTTAADTAGLTGGALYDAPEDDGIVHVEASFNAGRPLTWRGAQAALAGLVLQYGDADYAARWDGLLDYPEPDANGRNAAWIERRERIAKSLPNGYHCPEFVAADEQLQADLYEERRSGWTQRALRVLEEELDRDSDRLAGYRASAAAALTCGDDAAVARDQQSVEYYEKVVAQHLANRAYLEGLFAGFPNEQALVDEIARVGRSHLERMSEVREVLARLLAHARAQEPDAAIAPEAWDAIVAQIGSIRSEYWTRGYGSEVLRKVESTITIDASAALREEVFDRYVSGGELDPGLRATLEPQLRHFESGHPHKLGGQIDSVYGDPLKRDHVLLFQLASDAAAGWICGDLGFVYVSIAAGDLAAGRFDKATAWLEA